MNMKELKRQLTLGFVIDLQIHNGLRIPNPDTDSAYDIVWNDRSGRFHGVRDDVNIAMRAVSIVIEQEVLIKEWVRVQ